ncbi:hypothetical protein ACFWG6_29115, partial [Streptomyces erythrochromogenes]|uniref:hypothetical protein n=1 Tax=Streptomyces erythrochromogenes TaxID=285574 RepID=UPI003650DF82
PSLLLLFFFVCFVVFFFVFLRLVGPRAGAPPPTTVTQLPFPSSRTPWLDVMLMQVADIVLWGETCLTVLDAARD